MFSEPVMPMLNLNQSVERKLAETESHFERRPVSSEANADLVFESGPRLAVREFVGGRLNLPPCLNLFRNIQ